MDITWYGQSCFRLRFRGATIITDPYNGEIGLKLPRQKADIVTVSHDHPDHANTRGVSGDVRVFTSPGEYERAGIFLFGIPTFHDRRNGRDRGRNTVFMIEGEDLTVCHLGDLGHVPTQTQIEQLNALDVLFIPVGGNPTLNAAEAAEVVSLLQPRYVIPMHYQLPGLKVKLDPLTKFLQAMGVAKVTSQEGLRVLPTAEPQETQLVVLEPKQ
ncbi:MAG TPA: MBL fold metallo-hydrolase [Anaerolineae bacterium]|nr:MBL fold metallo-hydrolase [Anaerolineae bacterium]HOQ98078.1 MBL fold metallo-hydrolase [Anaerolineae bacterium]HPL27408.1 MBL fold metallo-hydrolase [Anaerolineae bacterium]